MSMSAHTENEISDVKISCIIFLYEMFVTFFVVNKLLHLIESDWCFPISLT